MTDKNDHNESSATQTQGQPLLDRSLTRKTKRLILINGIILLFVLIGLVVLLLYVTDGIFYPGHWVAFYVAIALVSGIAFWFFTAGSTGEFTNKSLGIRLGGGAGIGAAFMVLAHFLTPTEPPPNIRIVDVRVEGISDVFYTSHSEELGKVTRLDGARFLVEFKEGENQGHFVVRYFRGEDPYWSEIHVPRLGELPEPVEHKGTR